MKYVSNSEAQVNTIECYRNALSPEHQKSTTNGLRLLKEHSWLRWPVCLISGLECSLEVQQECLRMSAGEMLIPTSLEGVQKERTIK